MPRAVQVGDGLPFVKPWEYRTIYRVGLSRVPTNTNLPFNVTEHRLVSDAIDEFRILMNDGRKGKMWSNSSLLRARLSESSTTAYYEEPTVDPDILAIVWRSQVPVSDAD